MKGIICEKAGEPFKIVDNLDVPEPSSDQILVKSIYMGLNPVDGMMQSSGVIVHEWPLFLGVDVAGVVVKVGENAASMFKVGDYVCGCTRVGYPGYNSGQEYLLMDAKVTIPKPKNISLVEAATIGVGLETAGLALFDCLDVKLPNLQEVLEGKHAPQKTGEWAIVLGGASSVGKFAIQLFGICGYKVMASCSAYSVPLVKNQGAEAVFDYKMSIAEQVNEVLAITKGKVHRVFDAAASGDEFAKELYKRLPEEGPKLFCSTNTWSGITDFEGVKTKLVELAVIGRPHAEHTNKVLAEYIPVFVALFEHENQLFPPPYDLVGQGGFEDALEAHQYQQKGAGRSNKVVAKIQDE
ncbi:oxidoreductase, zinc-binding dehydrogenase family, conidia-enriched transcript [Histoplasma ohiense]|nr:oxidoreductase, zinc-binding dehydrogenase family, conidia-enriched transcript [Histoplasma ohiense (nom. inval.)]